MRVPKAKCGGGGLSFFLGFVTAAALGWILVCMHVIRIEREDRSSLRLSQAETESQRSQAQELLALVQRVERLYDKAGEKLPSTPLATITPKHIVSGAGGSERRAIKSRLPDIHTVASQDTKTGVDWSQIHQAPADRFQNLVLALAANIDPKYFAIFCKSLRVAGSSSAAVVIFVNSPISADLNRVAKEHSVTVVPYVVAELEPTFLRKYHPSSLRWILYHRLLSLQMSNGLSLYKSVRKIIVLDARDTAFQSDPFTLLEDGKEQLLTFGEQRGARIDQCGWNSGWVKDCFGDEILRRVGAQNILCSGVSMGTGNAMRQYIAAMAAVLSGEERDRFFHHRLPQCERNGVDQGIHNVLIHLHFHAQANSLIPDTKILYPDNFAVVNLQSAKEITPNNGHRLSLPGLSSQPLAVYMNNAYGQVERLFSIVHQYDRSESLQRSLAEAYVSWIDWADPASEWRETSACASFDFVNNVELFRGMCDLGHVRTLSAASCCDACDRKTRELREQDPGSTKSCRAFSFTGGVCYLKSCDAESVQRQVGRQHQRGASGIAALPGGVCAFRKGK